MRLVWHFIEFCNKFNKINDTGADMLDFIHFVMRLEKHIKNAFCSDNAEICSVVWTSLHYITKYVSH